MKRDPERRLSHPLHAGPARLPREGRPREYEAGAKVPDLASGRPRRSGLVAIAGPFLDAPRDRFGETVNLGVLDRGSVRYVDARESPESFRLAERVGAALEAELELVRGRGYAVDDEESVTGAFCVGALVLDRDGTAVAALSISGPLTRFGEKRVAASSKAIREAAAAIRAKLGYQGQG